MCKDYPNSQVSREHFLDIQQAISQPVDELPEDRFTPRLADSYRSKGAAIMVCHDVMTKDWLHNVDPHVKNGICLLKSSHYAAVSLLGVKVRPIPQAPEVMCR